jgi:tRNA A-37 threonylcarbamoyl transferase component Bud32
LGRVDVGRTPLPNYAERSALPGVFSYESAIGTRFHTPGAGETSGGMPVETGLLPPRYRVPHRIGRGAMGDIYAATDEVLGREVAIKVLADRYAADEAIRQRFKREALAAARLSGEPGAVTIFDVGEWQGRPFIVMEHLTGGSLEDRLRREGAQPPERALAWLEQAGAALDAAHRHGIVHRDVKPANLLLNDRNEVRVADFGIASAAGFESLTLTGTVLGTAGYLSPEQAAGERAGPASDLYALAVVAYELLSGHRPFESDSATAEAAAHVNEPVPSIAEQRHLPWEVDRVFQRALAKGPRARYGSGREFVAELRRALAHTAARPTVPLAPATGVRRRGSRGRPGYLLPLALLLVAAAVGGIVAGLVFGGGGSGPEAVTRTIAGPAGPTVAQTVTGPTTTAPAPPPPPPPPPPQAAAGADGHTLNDQGYSLMQQGDYARALPLLQQAVQKLAGSGPADPYEGYANYNLGYTLYSLGRCPEAVAFLKRAEHLEPDRSEPKAVRKQAQHC